MFSSEFCEVFKNTLFIENLRTAAFENSSGIALSEWFLNKPAGYQCFTQEHFQSIEKKHAAKTEMNRSKMLWKISCSDQLVYLYIKALFYIDCLPASIACSKATIGTQQYAKSVQN